VASRTASAERQRENVLPIIARVSCVSSVE
jgi:hypothetical protein